MRVGASEDRRQQRSHTLSRVGNAPHSLGSLLSQVRVGASCCEPRGGVGASRVFGPQTTTQSHYGNNLNRTFDAVSGVILVGQFSVFPF